jgi:hypothetical protein
MFHLPYTIILNKYLIRLQQHHKIERYWDDLKMHAILFIE